MLFTVDVDNQPAKEVIDHYMSRGYQFLFDDQVCTGGKIQETLLYSHRCTVQCISFSTQSRDHTYELIVEAIKRAIQHCTAHDTLTARYEQMPDDAVAQKHPQAIHASRRTGADAGSGAGFRSDSADHATIFRQRVLEKYESVTAVFDRFKEVDGTVSRKGFKGIVGSLGMSITDQERKQLRKMVCASKAISFAKFAAFMDHSGDKGKLISQPEEDGASLAELPSEVLAIICNSRTDFTILSKLQVPRLPAS